MTATRMGDFAHCRLRVTPPKAIIRERKPVDVLLLDHSRKVMGLQVPGGPEDPGGARRSISRYPMTCVLRKWPVMPARLPHLRDARITLSPLLAAVAALSL